MEQEQDTLRDDCRPAVDGPGEPVNLVKQPAAPSPGPEEDRGLHTEPDQNTMGQPQPAAGEPAGQGDSPLGGQRTAAPRYTAAPPVRVPNNNMATASMIVGIVSLLACCCYGIGGIMLGSVGIILALLSRVNEPLNTHGKVGLITSIISLTLGFITLFALLAFGWWNIAIHGGLGG